MPKDTPSMAKNKIRRSLVAICDPHPSNAEINELWQYFNSSCAYCGVDIERESRTGHIDHLVPASEGGSNSIYNHALSCAVCNGDEKREESWQSFLARKCQETTIEQQRKEKIQNWLSRAPKNFENPEQLLKSESIISEAIKNYEVSVSKMRELRASGT